MCRIDAWVVSEPPALQQIIADFWGEARKRMDKRAMATIERKSFDKPEETCSINKGENPGRQATTLKACHPQRMPVERRRKGVSEDLKDQICSHIVYWHALMPLITNGPQFLGLEGDQ